ncbi:hypothetical protein M2145_002914 [Lachnospiraceae bacterium PF1-21]
MFELSQDLCNVYPIFTKNRNVVVSEENGRYSVNSARLISTLYLNKTSYEIVSLCNGTESLESIIKAIQAKYKITMEKAFNDIMGILYPLWKIRLLMFSGGIHPFCDRMIKSINVNENLITYKVEKSGSEVTRFMANNKAGFINAHSYDREEISKKRICTSFIYNEEVFFSLNIDNKPLVMISLTPQFTIHPYLDCLYYNLNYIFVDEKRIEVIDKYFKDFIEWSGNWCIKEVNQRPPEKFINLYFVMIYENYLSNLDLFQKIKLQKRGLFKNEIKNKDAVLLEYAITTN